MPTADAVLSWATVVANDWRGLAIAWHVALASFLIAVMRGRVTSRSAAHLLVLPLISVAAVAWRTGNPFNGLVFTAVSAMLLRSARRLPSSVATPARRHWQAAGVLLVLFGWLYPHFIETDSWLAYAYASPFGLLPCPTLAGVAGWTLVFGGFRSAMWTGTVAGTTVLYGAIGVFRLGVILDAGLLAAGTLLVLAAASLRLGLFNQHSNRAFEIRSES